MNVLIISPTQSGIGGISQHIQGLKNFLEKHDHKVEIISSENTFTIPIKGLKNPSFMISSFFKSKFKKNQHIVHAHNIPAALAMKNTSGKKILSLHGIFSQQINQLHGKQTGNISTKYEKNALDWADAITVVSKEAYDYYTNLGYNVFQIPNAINFSSLTSKIDRRYEKQIIFVGRLSREKGIDNLISISKKLPNDVHLVILGTGPEEHKIIDLVKNHKNIHFFGYQKKEETISLIRGSDILIQPSLNEGISSTILEAMACKTIVVTTNVGGNKELIISEETGFLLSINSDLFIERINYIFTHQDMCEKIINNAFRFAQQYDWNEVGKKYLKLYEKLLD